MNTKTVLACSAVVIAFALFAAPLAIAGEAEAKHKKGDKKTNIAKQSIEQKQKSSQNSLVVSGGNSILSGNNVNVQVQSNTGSNVAGQSNN